MALPDEVADLETIDDASRGHYRESGGMYILQVDSKGGRTLEDVSGLRKTLEKELQLRKSNERDAKDVTAERDRLKANLDKARKSKDDGDDERETEWQRERQELVDQHGKALLERETELTTLRTEANDSFRNRQLDEAIAEFEKETGRRPSRRGLELLFEKEALVELNANGQRVLKVHDPKDGRVLLSKTNHGGEMQLLERLNEMSEAPDLGGFFPGTGAHGSGADGRSTAGGQTGDLPTGMVSSEDAGGSLEAIAAGKVTISD